MPNEGINILVGANSAGKSTVLDAIELVTKGSLNGTRASNALAPDWFNAENAERFFESLEEGAVPSIPEIMITVTFSDDPAMASICGCNGPEGPSIDAPGLFMHISVPQELLVEFLNESKSIALSPGSKSIPVEYYACEWKSFKDADRRLVRRPSCITCSRVDARPAPYTRAVDSYARDIVESELTEGQLREISRKIRKACAQIDSDILSQISVEASEKSKSLGLQLDQSPRSDWRNNVTLAREGLPFSALGSAEQIVTKCAISLEKSTNESILLMEEPECHLSHTSLQSLLGLIEESMADGQQLFITTHSPFVLNRLGLNNMSIIAAGFSPQRIGSLSPDTVRYFKKLSGYDTLRIVLSEKTVLVEGPTDEMVFDWAFRKMRGCLPQEKGIDVIESGVRYKRALELAAAVDKSPVVALRDNDDKAEEHWVSAVEAFESDGRKLLVGHDDEGRTIEPQMVCANSGALATLAKAVGVEISDSAGLESYLLNHKVEWSLNLLEADEEETACLNAPRYIVEAIDFIDPVEPDVRE
mgnify:CR=1 FL=1